MNISPFRLSYIILFFSVLIIGVITEKNNKNSIHTPNTEYLQKTVFYTSAIVTETPEAPIIESKSEKLTSSTLDENSFSDIDISSISDEEIDALLDKLSWGSVKKLLRNKLSTIKSSEDLNKVASENSNKESSTLNKDTTEHGATVESNIESSKDSLSKDLRKIINKDNIRKTSEKVNENFILPFSNQYENMFDETIDGEIKHGIKSSTVSDQVGVSQESKEFEMYNVDPEVFQALYQPSKEQVNKEELGSSDNSNATLFPGLSIGDILVVERCPATQRTFSPSCFCTRIKLWTCPAGSYCLAPRMPRKCPPGFYCPPNSFQPSFCCGGYYCPSPNTTHLCPAGSYCQEGSIAPRTCYFGKCPRGSKTIRKYEVFLFFLGFLVTIWIGHTLRLRQVARQRHSYLRQFRAFTTTPTPLSFSGPTDNILRFDITFKNLGLRLPDGIDIMRGVTGRLAAGRTCAIMGPSGAGKTTFVSLLTGKVAKTSGLVNINGKEDTLSRFRKLVGFVPQEDIMLRQLTVEEILSHAAQLRLPSCWSKNMREAKVMEIIKLLGLEGVMHQTVGDEETRGISGGQRKRVNIGMELVADPAIMFLDEPTSGLDSATSVEVCTLLANIARNQGLTIAAVIHSPSPPAFSLFDDLLLLGRGGRILYHGPCLDAPDYFSRAGYPVPDVASPADHYMEVASGKIINSLVPAFPTSALFDLWSQYYTSQQEKNNFDVSAFIFSQKALEFYGAGRGLPHTTSSELDSEGTLHVTFDDNGKSRFRRSLLQEIYGQFKVILVPFLRYLIVLTIDIFSWLLSVYLELYGSLLSFFKDDSVRVTPGSFTVFQLCFKRSLVQIFRFPLLFATDQLLHLGCGLFISIAAQNSVFLGPLPDAICLITPLTLYVKCKRPIIDQAAQIGNFISWGIGFAGISVGAGTFGHERIVHWREASWGVPFLPYFFAKTFADLPRLLIASFMFTLSLVAVYPNAAPFYQLYYIVATLYYWGFSTGYLISSVVRSERAPLVGVAVALLWAMVFSGVQPTLRDINATWGPNVQWLWSISAPRWAIGAFYIAETEAPDRSYMDPNHVGRKWFGYHNDGIFYNLFNVILIAFGWQFLAILGFKLFNRDKRL